jgi:hypothetical protein
MAKQNQLLEARLLGSLHQTLRQRQQESAQALSQAQATLDSQVPPIKDPGFDADLAVMFNTAPQLQLVATQLQIVRLLRTLTEHVEKIAGNTLPPVKVQPYVPLVVPSATIV